MSLTNIQKLWEAEKFKLQCTVDNLCTYRVKQLVAGLKHFRITKLIFGNGAWLALGDDFPVTYEDESHGKRGIQVLFDWCTNGGNFRYLFEPTEITTLEVELVRELAELCDWWVDISGGEDVTFHA